MKLTALTARRMAGYASVTWRGLQKDVNFLVGRNGAGKSTLLQLLCFALEYIGGRRTEDVLARTEEGAILELVLDVIDAPLVLNVDTIRTGQGGARRQHAVKVLQFTENRQPKNTIGIGRNQLRDHPTARYPNTVSELKELLGSKQAADRAVAEEAFAWSRRIPVGGGEAWDWIGEAIQARGQKRGRPVSCGQFDVAALCLDLVRLRHEVAVDPCAVFVVLDNPDSYLHPACQEPMLTLIREVLPDAQLFVASHSLKLLCYREPKSVFWLSRENQDLERNVRVQSVRELDHGSRSAFFELYGDDVNAAVLRLLTQFEQPEYFKFLCECALPAQPEHRPDPGRDRQMLALREELGAYRPPWTILDFGAGHGDLLEALRQFGHTNAQTTYVASTQHASVLLAERLERAKSDGKLSVGSRVLRRLDEAPAACDAIVLCNTCHEIGLKELPGVLARLLREHLRRSLTSKLVIHEVETLPAGEAGFIVWTPGDYQEIFARAAPSFGVSRKREERLRGVPLDATVITWADPSQPLDCLEADLSRAFAEQLRSKRETCLAELEERTTATKGSDGLDEAMRQRRVAFLMAQIAGICLAERDLGKNRNQ